MFENAQQEPSGGNTKVVAGVIVVLMAVLAGVYFAYFHGAGPATTAAPAAAATSSSGGGAPAPDADYKRDLAIVQFNLGRDQTQTMAMWDIQVSNRSRTIGYRNIKYATNYYDAGNNVVYQGAGTLAGQIAPGERQTFSEINDGLFPLSAVRYTIEFTSADGFLP